MIGQVSPKPIDADSLSILLLQGQLIVVVFDPFPCLFQRKIQPAVPIATRLVGQPCPELVFGLPSIPLAPAFAAAAEGLVLACFTRMQRRHGGRETFVPLHAFRLLFHLTNHLAPRAAAGFQGASSQRGGEEMV